MLYMPTSGKNSSKEKALSYHSNEALSYSQTAGGHFDPDNSAIIRGASTIEKDEIIAKNNEYFDKRIEDLRVNYETKIENLK